MEAFLALPTSPLHAHGHGAFARYALATGVAAPRRGKLLAVGVPAGCLMTSWGGRRAVLARAAASPGGSEDDDEPVPMDKEAVVLAFRMELQIFKICHRALAFLDVSKLLLHSSWEIASNSVLLYQCLLANKEVDAEQYKDVVRAAKASTIVEEQCKERYVRADALVDAIRGLKLSGDIFFPDLEFPEHVVVKAMVPRRSRDVDNKEQYMLELVRAFFDYFDFVAGQAYGEFGFTCLRGRRP